MPNAGSTAAGSQHEDVLFLIGADPKITSAKVRRIRIYSKVGPPPKALRHFSQKTLVPALATLVPASPAFNTLSPHVGAPGRGGPVNAGQPDRGQTSLNASGNSRYDACVALLRPRPVVRSADGGRVGSSAYSWDLVLGRG
jgi:hypothetical protein